MRKFFIALFLMAQSAVAFSEEPAKPEAIDPYLFNPSQRDWDRNANPSDFALIYLLDVDPYSEVPSRNPVNDDSLKNLEKFKNLRTLIIQTQLVTDRGLKHILKVHSLEAVVLCDCPVSDEGVQSLAKLPKLVTVGFFQTKVTLKGAKDLEERIEGSRVEVWSEHGSSRNRIGQVFVSDGCWAHQFTRKHFRISVPQGDAKK